jgi:hypothetical protein
MSPQAVRAVLKEWWHERVVRVVIYLVVGDCLLVAAIWLGFFFPWGTEHEFLKGRNPWQNKPTLGKMLDKNGVNVESSEVKDEKWTEVLIKLLEQDREEIRFWQAHLFTITLGFDAAILAIVSFALQTKRFTDVHRVVFIGGCIFLCASYLLFLRFVDGAIAVNDYDLIGIQFGLRLSEAGRYLEGQPIYKEGPSPGQSHIWKLALFDLALVVLSVAVLAFWKVGKRARTPKRR